MITPTCTRPLTILKAGGAVVSDPTFSAALARHVADLVEGGDRVVLVHGGGLLISELHQRLGLETVKHGGLRATPEESMQVVAMALRGAANASLVGSLVAAGVAALGVSGVDLGLLRSSFLNRERLGRVGGPPRVDALALTALLDQGYVPVLAPVCLAPDGGLVNVNADTVAHAVAVALCADGLDFVSDVPGVYGPRGRLCERLRSSELSQLLGSPAIQGGMIPKLQASLDAVNAGVGTVRIGTLASLSAGEATEVIR